MPLHARSLGRVRMCVCSLSHIQAKTAQGLSVPPRNRLAANFGEPGTGYALKDGDTVVVGMLAIQP